MHETQAGPKPWYHEGPARKSTRTDIINRAKGWVSAKVPYSTTAFWSDGYRQDCSGFVSMAWNLAGNEWTGSLAEFGTKIARADLQPGDILLFHNPADPNNGSHVTIFGGWTDFTHTFYLAYELAPPHARAIPTPMAYWTDSSRYVPYRYKGIITASDADESTDAGMGEVGTTATAGSSPHSVAAAAGGGQARPTGNARPHSRDDSRPWAAYPGRRSFGPSRPPTRMSPGSGRCSSSGAAGVLYSRGPGARWSRADRRATQAFQLAQGWRGARGRTGCPRPRPGVIWSTVLAGTSHERAARRAAAPPVFPGSRYFRAGQAGPYVEKLGKQLVKKGFGKSYVSPPGPRWDETDRRAVEAFQRAQGWRGRAADGYPGPETWRRLFA